MAKNDGGQAFPTRGASGMTLRDWFAGQFIPAAVERSREEPFQEASDVAAYLYEFADAMIAERGK